MSTQRKLRFSVLQSAAPQSSAPDPMEAIEKLSKLHAQGALTDEEFTKKKAELLNRI